MGFVVTSIISSTTRMREVRSEDANTPIVVVPTTFDSVYEEELKQHGINMVIYANHMLRAAFPAMQSVAETILENERCLAIS